MIESSSLDPKGNRFWKVIEEPSVEPISVTEFKEFARIDGTDEDELIEGFITAVREATESYLRRALITQKIRLIMDEWNVRDLELPRPPLQSVSKIATVDEDETETEYSSDNYFVITEAIPGRVVIKDDYSLPLNSDRDSAGYRVEFYAGYGSSGSSVPRMIREAMKLWTAQLYEQRNLTPDPPPEAKAMLYPYRVIMI